MCRGAAADTILAVERQVPQLDRDSRLHVSSLACLRLDEPHDAAGRKNVRTSSQPSSRAHS
eukprot:15796-Hanusia_phi.AAC.3